MYIAGKCAVWLYFRGIQARLKIHVHEKYIKDKAKQNDTNMGKTKISEKVR